jgi:drug/metabolite transporter (DMT)-like permease
MPWYIYAALAPALWAGVNHIDKYIVTRYFSGIAGGPAVLFTSLASLLFAIIISFFVPISVIGIYDACVIVIGGMIFVAAYIPYFIAMQTDEASVVAPLYQMMLVFVYILGFVFLGEKLGTLQIVAGLIIITGSIILTIDLESPSYKIKSRTFFLMVLASFLLGINSLLFKIVALNSSFWVTSFWEYIGASIFGIILIVFFKRYKRAFSSVWKKNGVSVVRWNIGNESLNLIARMSANFASLFAPLALVSIVGGAQPFFIMLYGIIIPFIFRKQVREKFTGKFLVQKVTACVLIFIGVYLLFK